MLVDIVPLVAVVALLATAYAHPRALVEAGVAVLAAGAVLATGALGTDDLEAEREHLLPVVLFLVAILVVAECCRREGVFAAVGSQLARAGSPQVLFAATFAVAAVTTVVLSLDATVVLVTPVVLAATATLDVSARPFQLVCVRLANTASLLLPVSNLTNLISVPATDLSFGRFALLMASVWVFVLVVEYVVHRLRFGADLAAAVRTSEVSPQPLPVVPVVVVALMLAGFAVGSAYDVDPAWVAGAAALVLAARGLLGRTLTVPAAVRSGQPAFALFVLALGLVVAALGTGPLGDLLADVVPDGTGLGALLGVALIGAVLANLVNNLPATLLLVPLVAPLGAVPVLATLVGINLGSSMTWSGSLANLLWRRSVTQHGGTVSSRDFHLVGLLASPVGIVGGVVLLDLTARLVY